MDVDELMQAAAEGAICPECGGVHVVDAESATLLSVAEERTGNPVPWCDCEGCELCRDLWEAIARMAGEEQEEPWRWGDQSNGWYIDDQGRVWRLSTALHWWPEIQNILQGSEDTLYYAATELEQSYTNARDSLVAAIEANELREKYLLISGAARGNYSPPVNGGADMGSLVTGCLAYDREAERYRRVILRMTGDWEVINLADSATELDAWLRGLAEQFDLNTDL